MTSRRSWSAAFLPPAGDEEAAAPLSERGWETTLVGMHLISGAVWCLALTATFLGQNEVGAPTGPSPWSRWPAWASPT